MTQYDFCLAWNWEYDADFVALLEEVCCSQGLSLLQITPETLAEGLRALAGDEIGFRVLFDRASDSDPRFISLAKWARNHHAYRINRYELASRAWDKAAMHAALTTCLSTPDVIVIPSFDEQPSIAPLDLSPLGDTFSIKPVHGGGGEGVVLHATSMDQVLVARQEFPSDRYLLQAHVAPVQLGSHPAWFRVVQCTGKAYLFWWGLETNYEPVSAEEEADYALGRLRRMAASIAEICGLELFSTEIAITASGRFVVVDYVNDPVDLRLQSKTPQGIPNDAARDIAERLVLCAVARCPKEESRSIVQSSGMPVSLPNR